MDMDGVQALLFSVLEAFDQCHWDMVKHILTHIFEHLERCSFRIDLTDFDTKIVNHVLETVIAQILKQVPKLMFRIQKCNNMDSKWYNTWRADPLLSLWCIVVQARCAPSNVAWGAVDPHMFDQAKWTIHSQEQIDRATSLLAEDSHYWCEGLMKEY